MTDFSLTTSLYRTVRGFLWFLWQCYHVGGLGAGLFWLMTVCLLTAMVFSYRSSPSEARDRFPWLNILPLSWTAVGLWGSYFWLDTRPEKYKPHPAWVAWPVGYGLLVYLIAAVLLIFYIRQGRTFACLFAVFNLYFMLGMTFLASMAVSGTWL